MKPLHRPTIGIFLLTVALSLGWAPHAAAQMPLAAPYEGVLILKNGNALQGRITQEGEYYVLALNDHSVIRLQKERVDFACRTMEEAYLQRKAKVGTTTLDAHVELAHWCLNLGLWEEATYHHAIALRSGPERPAVVRLDRRYQVKLAERNRPSEVVQASYTEPQTTAEASSQGKSADPLPGDASPDEAWSEGDETEPSLPPQILHYFTSNVQPLLLNSCATSRCHAVSAENEFRLVQFDSVRTIPRRMTVRNMNAALRYIDFENPVKSSLLTHSSSQHGGENLPNLSPAQLHAIRVWVGGVIQSGQPAKKLPAAAQESKVIPAAFHAPVQMSAARPSTSRPTVSGSGGNPDAAAVNPIFGGDANAALPGAGASPIPMPFRSTPKTPQMDEAPAVRDEFDPELFNRRYHPNRQAPLFPE